MISVLHPRDMEQPVVTLDETNGWFQHKRPLTLRPVKVVSWSTPAGLAEDERHTRNEYIPTINRIEPTAARR